MFKRILVAIDFSPASDAALGYARTLAARFDGSLHLVHVLENDFLRPVVGDANSVEGNLLRWLQSRLTEGDLHRSATAAVLKSDEVADAILAYAREVGVDLIVLGTHGRSNLAHVWRPSVAERVVREAHCPVLTGRPRHALAA
jgi:nucleotide-binding universal stress UspA family protein